MSERKVLNKYIPPTFDPKKISNKKPRGGGGNKKVRLMAPFSMQCTVCGDYIYKGKKFNARKEIADGENYLGIEILRFTISCPCCASQISFKVTIIHIDRRLIPKTLIMWQTKVPYGISSLGKRPRISMKVSSNKKKTKN